MTTIEREKRKKVRKLLSEGKERSDNGRSLPEKAPPSVHQLPTRGVAWLVFYRKMAEVPKY